MPTAYGYTYDYTKTMMMKMGLSHPDRKGGSKVLLTFADAMEIIQKTDRITQGIPKIIYLVGWQYLGHDDKYPDFFEVNPLLKRPQDASAYESLLWLMENARRYHTIVSLHINFNDAYEDAPSFPDFVEQNALIRRRNGKPWPIERYNGKPCYKTSFKEYWESGLFHRQAGRLLRLFPLEEQGTVHVDNFQCYTSYAPYVSIEEMQRYRDKMIGYFRDKGIDITTEFTCREHNGLRNVNLLRPRDHNPKMPIAILGKTPAVWWLTYLSDQELVEIEPQLLSGGLLRIGARHDSREKMIYGNMHGEDVFLKYSKGAQANWTKAFLQDFATIQVPYYFLCTHRRLQITGKKGNRSCQYADGVVSFEKGRKIAIGGQTVKENDTLCLPFVLLENTLFAYSREGDQREWPVSGRWAGGSVYEITPSGNQYLYDRAIENGRLRLDILPGQGLLIALKA